MKGTFEEGVACRASSVESVSAGVAVASLSRPLTNAWAVSSPLLILSVRIAIPARRRTDGLGATVRHTQVRLLPLMSRGPMHSLGQSSLNANLFLRYEKTRPAVGRALQRGWHADSGVGRPPELCAQGWQRWRRFLRPDVIVGTGQRIGGLYAAAFPICVDCRHGSRGQKLTRHQFPEVRSAHLTEAIGSIFYFIRAE